MDDVTGSISASRKCSSLSSLRKSLTETSTIVNDP